MNKDTIRNLETVVLINLEDFGEIGFDVKINEFPEHTMNSHSIALISKELQFAYYTERLLVSNDEEKYTNLIKETVAEMLTSEDFKAYKKLSDWDFTINENDVIDKEESSREFVNYLQGLENRITELEKDKEVDVEKLIKYTTDKFAKGLKPYGFIK